MESLSSKRDYCQTSGISHTNSQKCLLPALAVVSAQSVEARCQVENVEVDGAVPTVDAPTTSEWSTILLPAKQQLEL